MRSDLKKGSTMATATVPSLMTTEDLLAVAAIFA
jgi:hypothetical protein